MADDDIDAYLASKGFKGADTSGLTTFDKSMLGERLQSSDREQQAGKDYASKRGELEQGLFGAMKKEIAEPLPKTPQLPEAPKEQYRNPFEAFQNPAVILAGIASLATRAPLTAAFQAGAAALEGFHKGDKEAIEQHTQNWKNAVEKAEKQNRLEVDAYTRVMEKRNLAVKEKLAEMQALAAGFKDQVTLESLRRGDIDFINDVIQKRKEAGSKLEKLQLQELLTQQRIQMNQDKMQRESEGRMDDETLRDMVNRTYAGEKGVAAGVGRGIQGSANLARYQNMLSQVGRERNLPADTILKAQREAAAESAAATSAARTSATQSANLSLIATNLDKQLPAAEAMSAKIPRGKYVPLNQLMQAANTQISDPDLLEFKVANLQVAELWARAMNPKGVMRIEDRHLAMDLLNTVTSHEAYVRVLKQLKNFVDREREAVKEFMAAHGGERPDAPITLPDLSGGQRSSPAGSATAPVPPLPGPGAQAQPSAGWAIKELPPAVNDFNNAGPMP